VIILTTFGRAGYIKRALAYGVGGFLLKDAPSDDLINAIKQVMAGKRVIDPELAFNAIGEIDPLNDKERAPCQCGLINQRYSQPTVYCRRNCEKLFIRSD
jgi:DNA-binding NarL/FixJ family response regulator